MQLTAVASPPATLQTTKFASFLTPQYLTNQQQFYALNSAFYQAPASPYGYTPGHPYVSQFYANLPLAPPPNVITINEQIPALAPRMATTKRPVFRDREPTTRKPQATLHIKPQKLQVSAADFKHDVALLKAVEKINPEYVIEEIFNVPGKHIYSAKTTEKKITNTKKQVKLEKTTGQPIDAVISSNSGVKVEATGKTSTTGTIPEIPFSTYFLPYFSQNQRLQAARGKQPAALILEPHSKAIVGNGGTAISTPISRAYLKRGVATNVYFNPESVAIAGVGGKAHAQADLELDLIK